MKTLFTANKYVHRGKSGMKLLKNLQIILFPLTIFMFILFSTMPALAANPPEVGTDGHLKQTMECEWAILNNGDNPEPEDYINDPEDDLVKLANSLKNDPVEIYNWVKKHIKLDKSYSNSRLGARMTYLNKRGNEWDISSLLITLLRISKIPAKYVFVEATAIILKDRVYVHAWVPLDNYRNGVNGQDYEWVPLCPWEGTSSIRREGLQFFEMWYALWSDQTIPPELDFDFDDYLTNLNDKTPLDLYEEDVRKYMAENHPGEYLNNVSSPAEFTNEFIDDAFRPSNFWQDSTDILEYGAYSSVLRKKTSILPSTLQTEVFVSVYEYIVSSYKEVPSSRKKNITLSFDRIEGENRITLLQRTIYLPEIAGKRFCLDFIPASETDRITIESNGGMCTQESINAGAFVRPVLKVEGNIMPPTVIDGIPIAQAVGEPIQLGDNIQLSYEGGGYAKTYRPRWKAGTFAQIAMDPLAASPQNIEKLKKELITISTSMANYDNDREQYLGRMSNILAQTYLLRLFEDQARVENLFGCTVNRNIGPILIYTFPYNMKKDKESKFFIHPQWNIDATTSGSLKDDGGNTIPWDDPRYKLARNLWNFSASYNEGRIFEDWLDTQGLNTIKGIMIAYENGIQVEKFLKTENDSNGHIALLNSLKYCANLDPNNISTDHWITITARMKAEMGLTPADTNWTQVKALFVDGTWPLSKIEYMLKDLGDVPSDALDDNTIDDVLTFLDNGDAVTMPLKLIEYEGMRGYVILTQGDTSDCYLFNMNYGGENCLFTTEDPYYLPFDYTLSDPLLDYRLDDFLLTDEFGELDIPTLPMIPSEEIFALAEWMGDPVNMVTGEYFQEEKPDIKIKTLGFYLDIKRKYKSKLTFNGPFGYGWTWNHSQTLFLLNNNNILYFDEESNAMTVIDNGNGTYSYPPGAMFTIQQVNDEHGKYLITDKITQNKTYFSDTGLLVKKIDPFGNFLKFNRTNSNHSDKITEIEDSLGRKLFLTHNTNGKVEKVTDFEGRYCEYFYDGDDLIEFIDLEGHSTKYQYLKNQENIFNNHNMNKCTLPNGDWLEIAYYLNDTVAFHENAKGETFNFMYSRLNRYAETWNEEGYYRKVFFNENNDVIRTDNENGIIETMEYDAHHNKISQTDGNGNTTIFQYYPDGTPEPQQDLLAAERKLYIKTNAIGYSWRYRYDSLNNPFAKTEIIEPEGNITRFFYNEDTSLDKKIQAPGFEHNDEGLLVENSQSPGLITSYMYDDIGNILRITYPDETYMENSYDENKLYLVTTKDKNGYLSQYEYYNTCGSNRADWLALDALKSKSLILNDGILTTAFEYNLYGQVTKKTNPLNESVLFEYDENKNLILKTEANGAQTHYAYDTARDIVSGSKLLSVTDPEGHIETYTYDKVGNRISKTDKNNHTTRYMYDEMSRPLGEVDALNFSTWAVYDDAGNLSLTTDKRKNSTYFQYDAANQLIRKSHSIPLTNHPRVYSQTDYDGNGNKILEINIDANRAEYGELIAETTKYGYDVLNRIISKTIGFESPNSRTFEYRYNAANQIIRKIDPLGNFVYYEYDNNNNIIAQKSYDIDGITLLNNTQIEYYPDTRNLIKQQTIKNGFQKDGLYTDIIHYYQYDALGRKIAYTDPNGGITQYEYDLAGNLVTVIDPSDNITTHTYDKNRRRISTQNALNHTIRKQYDGVGNIILNIDAIGNETRNYYDDINQKISVVNALGGTTTYDYDSNGNLIASTDPKGNITMTVYDERNRAIKQIDAMAQPTLLYYDHVGRLIEKTICDFTFIGKGDELIKEGQINLWEHNDPTGQVTRMIKAAGTPDETTTDYLYNLNGNLAEEIDAMGIPTSYEYDGLGRLLSIRKGLTSDDQQILPAGTTQALVESYSYYPTGLVKDYTNPKGQITSFEYDGMGNKTKEIDHLGQITTWTYDLNNNLISIVFPENITNTYEYDDLNRLVIKNEKGVEIRLAYNENNQVIRQTNGKNIDTLFNYDGLGRLTQKNQGAFTPEQTITMFGYDSNSNIVFIKNSLNKTIFYQYDSLNRRTLETKATDINTDGLDLDNINFDSFSIFKSINYDKYSNPKIITKADGSQTYYLYDYLNRTTQIMQNNSIQQEFAYDALSRLIWSIDNNQNQYVHEVSYDNYNLFNLHTSETQNGKIIETAYDDNANLTGIQYPSGKTISQTYTDNNQIASIVNTGQNITLAQMTDYNGLGSLKQMTFGNGVSITLDYDAHNREESRSYERSGSVIYSHDIQTRDNQGNITAESIISSQGSIIKSHDYDALDRIIESTVTSKPDITWSYDTEGNWTQTSQNGVAETREVDNDNQYTVITGHSPDYDANGNMTSHNGQTLVYDWADRLIQVYESGSLILEYFYDALNRRVRQQDNSTGTLVVTEYVYNDSQIIEEYKDTVLDKTFVYADYMDDPIVMVTGTGRYYYAKDRQFNIKAVTDNDGNIVESYEYSAYGVMTIFDNAGVDITATGSAIGNPYGYTGRRWDSATELWYYRNRMYSPSMGRFMQRDPAGYVDGLNLYAYVLNNPLRYTDPDGLMARAAIDFSLDSIYAANSMFNEYLFFPLVNSAAYTIGEAATGWDLILDTVTPTIAEEREIWAASNNYSSFIADDLLFAGIAGLKKLPELVDIALDFIKTPLSKKGDDLISIFHGSADDATKIMNKGLDIKKTPTWVSRDKDAAVNAITKRYDTPKDSGIIESRIPKDQFDAVIKPSERPYPSGFEGEQLNTTEIVLRNQDQINLFNQNIVK